jgi:hypothetical protein
MNEFPQKKVDQHRQLKNSEAFDLYVRRIDHNLAKLLEQLISLRAIVNGEPEPLSKIQDPRDKRVAVPIDEVESSEPAPQKSPPLPGQ